MLVQCFTLLSPFSPDSDTSYIDARHALTISDVPRPIGICLLPSGNIVVGSSEVNQVRVYDPEGSHLFNVRVRAVESNHPQSTTLQSIDLFQPDREFKSPTDMVSLPDGRFAVRDDLGIQLFDEDGLFLQSVAENVLGR